MDVKNAEVLGNCKKGYCSRKKKRVAISTTYADVATSKCLSESVVLDGPFDRRCKRVRSGGCKNSCSCSFRKSLVKNYSNFKKSGLPCHVFFYRNGEWMNIPVEVLALLKADFQTKKMISEVVFEGQLSLFDFLHMVKINVETGLQQPIAWIDESGSCFFPVEYSDVGGNFWPWADGREDQNNANLEPNTTNEIKLLLEIALDDDESLRTEERERAFVSRAKRLKIEEELASNNFELKKDHGKPNRESAEGVGENVSCQYLSTENYGFELKHGKLERLVIGGSDYNTIQNMFVVSFAPIVNADDIVGISHGSPSHNLVQARLQLFEKQVEIMRTYRGDANVQYAWFLAPKEAVLRIIFHRFEHTEMPKLKPRYGSGIHLLPAKCSHLSSNYFDVDENGVQHMLLCRVIMGKVERIQSGSNQSHPSSENYDSGTDDLQNPKFYVVWDMHMNSHIYPEYVVSFKVPPKAKESWLAGGSKTDLSGVMQCDSSSPVVSVGDCNQISASEKQLQDSVKVPKRPSSPWMPFPMLFDAISSEISREDMNVVDDHYNAFKMKRLTRVELIKKLRSIVGDDLLRATIKRLQHEDLASVSPSWK